MVRDQIGGGAIAILFAISAVLFGLPILLVEMFGRPLMYGTFVLFTSWWLGLIMAGVAFYALRRCSRIVYGVIEVAFASSLLLVLLPSQIAATATIKETLFEGQLVFDVLLPIVGAIYFLVRGLDNIGEGLAPGGRAAEIWSKVFPTPKKGPVGPGLLPDTQERKR